jgi:hypothetical protein
VWHVRQVRQMDASPQTAHPAVRCNPGVHEFDCDSRD